MDVAADAVERDLMMEMGRGGDRHGIDALRQQFIDAGKGAAADELGCAGAVFRQRIDNADKYSTRQTCEHARMIGAHDAGADHADTKRALAYGDRL